MPLGDHESSEENHELFLGAPIVECPSCGYEQEQAFTVVAIDIEQIKDVPEQNVTCEECGHAYKAEYPGFSQYGYS